LENNIKKFFSDLNNILPFSKVVGVLGSFFTIFSIIYVLIMTFCKDENLKKILIIIEIVIAILSAFIVFFVLIISKHNKDSKNNFTCCALCLENNVKDGFHQIGLVHLSELIEMEGKMSSEKNPSECKVIIYTSDLGTEIEASEAVKKNREVGVEYIVAYLGNSYDKSQMEEITNCYGEKNLIQLSSKDYSESSIDHLLAEQIGFDITIYCYGNGDIKGYFAIDFVPENKHDCPNIHCQNRCNRTMKREPFYKEISVEISKALQKEILNLYNNQ